MEEYIVGIYKILILKLLGSLLVGEQLDGFHYCFYSNV